MPFFFHLILIILICFYMGFGCTIKSRKAAVAGRKKLHSISDQVGNFNSSPYVNCRICKSIVEPQGYVCQEHTVTTQDGYTLGMQRMHVVGSGKKADKPPVFLQHGLFCDAVTWLLNSPEESLGFILVDHGFDVWIANSRGCSCSQAHKSLSPNDPAYWEWSWDELVLYDLPSTLQYVQDQTGQKLHYVGHSLGTLMTLAALSQEKFLNTLRSAALLSPVAHLGQVQSLLIKAASGTFLAEELYWLGLHEFVPNGEEASKLVENACTTSKTDCSNLIDVFTGPNCCINASKVDAYLDHEPQPTSTKNMVHLSQMVRTGSIAMYDYGNENDNMNHYQQPTPPVYNMTNIPSNFPLYLAYGGQDTVADAKDVQVLLDDIKDHDSDKLVVQYVENYAHADFLFGVNANQVVYEPIIAFFSSN